MYRTIILLLALVLPVLGAQAKEAVLSRHGDNLSSVAQRYYDKVKNKYSSIEKYKEALLKWNSDIANWDDLKKDQILFVNYPYPYYLGEYVLPDKDTYKNLRNKGHIKFHLDYIGEDYTGAYDAVASNKKKANPLIIGLTGEYLFNPESAVEVGVNWKSAANSKFSGADVDIDLKLEEKNSINGHLYFKKYYLNKDLNLFFGYDQDHTDSLIIDTTNSLVLLEISQVMFHYASLGVGYDFYLFQRYFYTQIQFQNSVGSKMLSKNIEPKLDYKAQKIQFLLAFKSYDSFFINGFYNIINLDSSDSSSAKINQIGIGVGINLL